MAEASAPAYLQSAPTESPRITPAVQGLLVANVVLYFLQVTIVQPGDVAQWLGYAPSHFPARWWSPLTYAFVHGGFWHLALNLFGLWMFGPRVEHAWGTRAFVPFYVACALGGWGAHYAFARGGGLIGASAAVLGVMVAYASRWPDDEVYLFGVIPVKVRWFVVGLVVMNLASSLFDSGQGPGVAYVAHLGGLITGWLYLRVVGAPASGWRSRVETAPDLSDEPPRAIPRSSPKPREPRTETDDVVAKSRALFGGGGRRAAPRPPRDAVRREALDRVLDKIAQHGMGSLTADEKVLLDDESRRLREPS